MEQKWNFHSILITAHSFLLEIGESIIAQNGNPNISHLKHSEINISLYPSFYNFGAIREYEMRVLLYFREVK